MAHVSPNVPLLASDAQDQAAATTADGAVRHRWARRTIWTVGLCIAGIATVFLVFHISPPSQATDVVDDAETFDDTIQVIRGQRVQRQAGEPFESIDGLEFATKDVMTWTGTKQTQLQLPTTVKAANDILTRFKIRDAEAIFKKIPESNIEALFNDFLATIGSTAAHRPARKTLDSPEEYLYRLGVFSQFILLILRQNEFAQMHATRPDHARHGITVFADWTPDEFKSLTPQEFGAPMNSSSSPEKEVEAMNLASLPCSHVMVHPARQQGSCGSCWAFSTAETIRFSAMFQDGEDPGALSAEYLVDCYKKSCTGDNAMRAMLWLKTYGGIPSKDDYGPTLSADGQSHPCKAGIPVTATITSPFSVGGESAMAAALCSRGALSVMVFSQPALQSYHSGVLDYSSCPGTSVNHVVVLVGLDSTNGVWIMRNSWGTSWGVDPVTYKPGGGHALFRYGTNACNDASGNQYSPGPVQISKRSTCPAACRGSDCASGSPYDGGQNIVNNYCLHRCSARYTSGQRYCGSGPNYEWGDSVDCTSCVETQWILGARGQSCTATCSSLGKTCDEAKLIDIDTEAEIKEVAIEAGHPCQGTVAWSYTSNPGICTDPGCCGGSCVGTCAYGASVQRTCSSQSSSYSKLCPCG